MPSPFLSSPCRSRPIQLHAQAGDGVAFNDVFGKLSDLAREAKDYEWRRRDVPRDVFLQYEAAKRGSFSAIECADSAACLGDTKRLWLIVVNYSEDPFEGLPPDRADLLRLRFSIAGYQQFDKVRVVQLDRK